MNKRTLLRLGLLTLIGFPIPTFLVLYLLESIKPTEILDLSRLGFSEIGIGLFFGVLYALIALQLMKFQVFQQLPNRIERLVSQMKLTVLECIFLSLCAGVGEELLFRSGFQHYFGAIATSIFFVAIHGYLNPWNWRMSLYGVIVLPFILLLSFGFINWGLWFAISAHFSYDLVLFIAMRNGEESSHDELETIDLKNENATGEDSGSINLENL